MQQQWRKLSGERILRPIEDEVIHVLMKEIKEGHELKACIGTDSQVKGKITEVCHGDCIHSQRKGWFHVHT